MPIIYCQPESSEDFEAYLKIRYDVLRKPLGMPKGSERDIEDENAIHIIAKQGNKILGGGRIHFLDDHTAQVRYMAVLDKHKGQGIGAEILLNLEKFAFNQGRDTIMLHARAPVVTFYEKCGYKSVGDTFDLLGIPHLKMIKVKKL